MTLKQIAPRRIIAVFLIVACFILVGCNERTNIDDNPQKIIQVYRLAANPHTDAGLVVSESYTLPEGADEIRFAIEKVMGKAVSAELVSAFSSKFAMESFTLSDGELIINFEKGYLELSGIDKTAANCCLVMTLCSLSGVNSVSIYVDSERAQKALTLDSVVIVDTETNPSERQLRLYFPSVERPFLGSEPRTLTVDAEMPLYGYVVEELFRPPSYEGLSPIFPEGSVLLGISAEHSVCTVNLSREFYDNRPKTILEARLIIYSVVNSLTALSEIDAVRFLIDGETCESYNYIPLSEPLGRNEKMVAQGTSVGNEFELSLYMRVGDSDMLAAIQRTVQLENPLEVERSVITALMADLGEPGFNAVLTPEDDKNITVTIQPGVARIRLPRELFISREDDEVKAALDAMAVTILDLYTCSRVIFETSFNVSRSEIKLDYTRNSEVYRNIAE